MSYVENNLGKDEKIVLTAKKSWLCLIPQILFAVIVIAVLIYVNLVALKEALFALEEASEEFDSSQSNASTYIWIIGIFIAILPLIIRIINIACMHLAVTNKRIIGKVGVFKINAIDMPIDKIDHVQIQANFFGRIFHYYSFKIVSVGGAGFNDNRQDDKGFPAISNAQELKNYINGAIEQHAADARKAQAEEIARAMGK